MLTRSHRLFSIAVVELGLIATDTFLTNPVSNVVLLFFYVIAVLLILFWAGLFSLPFYIFA